MTKPTFSQRLRYWFDGVMAKGTGALIGLLALVTVAFIFVIAAIVQIFQLFPTENDVTTPLDFAEVVWGNLLRAMDAGTMSGDVGWGFRTLMLIVTLFGVLMLASLIGIISGAFDARLAELRKGRSKVLEQDHTLILGWSSKIVPIVSEICIANRSRKRSSIVILADRDKVEMEELLHTAVPHPGKTRIIVRSGDPMSLADLEISSPHAARSIIILPPDDALNPDAIVVKTALAITNNPHRRQERYHIVAEILDPRYLNAAQLVGRDEAHFVLSHDLISRIMAQTSQQSGLSVVYLALLDFDGDEIYFSEQPGLVGQSYHQTQRAFATSTVIGILRGESVDLNPPPGTVLAAGERLILIAEDESTVALAAPGTPDAAAISSTPPTAALPEHTLVLGYHRGLHVVLKELSGYASPGSSVTVMANRQLPEFESFDTLAVETQRGDVTDEDVLATLPLEKYEHVIVLADRDETAIQESDAKTLITLLNLRDLEKRLGIDLKIVSEMLDDRNRELAEVTEADDFIVSDRLISLVMSQISENRELTDVFDVLFSSKGSEICLQPAEFYVREGVPVDFYTVVEAAQTRGETAIGYRTLANARDSSQSYGVRLNPDKRERFSLGAGDKVIVLTLG